MDGDAVHTLEEARNFIDDVGFCLMYPERTLPRVATFMGAFVVRRRDCRWRSMLLPIRARNRPLT